MGLKIMKYRADMIGARFEIEANDPHGTVVTVAG
jgi:signal transduction histidine kinase